MLDASNKATWYRSGQAVVIAGTNPSLPRSIPTTPRDRPVLTAGVDAFQN